MRVIKNIENAFVSDVTNHVIAYVGDIFDSIDIRLGNEDYIISDNRKAIICINKENTFLLDSDREGMEILLLKRILSLRFNGRLAELLTDREIIRIGLGDKLLYYYYVLLSNPRKITAASEFVEINLPWMSFYPFDKDNSQVLRELAGNFQRDKELEAKTERLFSLLSKNLYTARSMTEAESEWTRLVEQ